MWTVLLSPDVQTYLFKQDRTIEVRIRKGLAKLECDDPFRYLEHYEGSGYYKYRIGGYRALVDVKFEKQMLLVQVLDKRSRIIIENDYNH